MLLGDSVSLNAMQKIKKVHSPYDFRIDFHLHDEFREIIKKYCSKE